MKWVVFLFVLFVVQGVPVCDFEIVKAYPHDPQAFTQGLIFGSEDTLYEGIGLYGSSGIREVRIHDGKILKEVRNNPLDFGEGITLFNDSIFQLTWKEHKIYKWNLNFTLLETYVNPFDGWGLTADRNNLIMSDGTSTIRFLSPADLHVERTVEVTMDGKRVRNINELEYIDDEIWANVWYSNNILRFNPLNGVVNYVIDLSALSTRNQGEDVLNGIAWSESTRRLIVGGKLWKYLYEIRVCNNIKKNIQRESSTYLQLIGVLSVVIVVIFCWLKKERGKTENKQI